MKNLLSPKSMSLRPSLSLKRSADEAGASDSLEPVKKLKIPLHFLSLKKEIPLKLEETQSIQEPQLIRHALSPKKEIPEELGVTQSNQKLKLDRSILALKKNRDVKLAETQSSQVKSTSIENNKIKEAFSDIHDNNNLTKDVSDEIKTDYIDVDTFSQDISGSAGQANAINIEYKETAGVLSNILTNDDNNNNIAAGSENDLDLIFRDNLTQSTKLGDKETKQYSDITNNIDSNTNCTPADYSELKKKFQSSCNASISDTRRKRNPDIFKEFLDDINYIKNNNIATDDKFNLIKVKKEEQFDNTFSQDINCSEQRDCSSNNLNSNISHGMDSDLNEATEDFSSDNAYRRASFSVSFGLTKCKDVNVTTKNSNIETMHVSVGEKETNIDCKLIEKSQETHDSWPHTNWLSTTKPSTATVNLEIKKNMSDISQSRVLILKTNAPEKISHIIVQPPNYQSVTQKIVGIDKLKNRNGRKSVFNSRGNNGNKSVQCYKSDQTRIDDYFRSAKDSNGIENNSQGNLTQLCNNGKSCNNEDLSHDDMSKNLSRADTARSDGIGRLCRKRDENDLPKMPVFNRDNVSPMRQENRSIAAEGVQLPSPRSKIESVSSCSPTPRRHIDSSHFHPSNTKTHKSSTVAKEIPHYKIVAGTHFAVDAFCYGDIPSVKHYFLTHFHSDHYSGLKKSFNKLLFCSQITANLCTSRLGVNSKYIHVMKIDETIRVDSVEVTAVDSNHCPGAVMLVFTLPNGKTLLHTGDFRATYIMESHPIFWNKDIHTIYLDTTYCNPAYNFPTQEESICMAVEVLRQKKKALEQAGKSFSSVLIVCGTYTIGKEKFFLGVASSVQCKVWACAEKDRVLRTVEGRSFGHATPQACQLHVLPMRDITHEKLRSYLDEMKGAFTEVVAFKPSGWENKKIKVPPVTKDMVTIHGIPYSEHSSFTEMLRFVNFLKPKQVIPTVDISGGFKAVQKYFPCPLVCKENVPCQSILTNFFAIQNRQQITAVS